MFDNDDIAAIIYGRFGRGAYVFGTAEITNLDMGFGIPDMSEDSFTFWVNMMNWFAEEMLAVPNLTDDLPTTWGYIRAMAGSPAAFIPATLGDKR